MTKEIIRETIDNLKKSVEECEEEAVLLSATASNLNGLSFFRNEIDKDIYRKNGIEIGKLAENYITRCRCKLRQTKTIDID